LAIPRQKVKHYTPPQKKGKRGSLISNTAKGYVFESEWINSFLDHGVFTLKLVDTRSLRNYRVKCARCGFMTKIKDAFKMITIPKVIGDVMMFLPGMTVFMECKASAVLNGVPHDYIVGEDRIHQMAAGLKLHDLGIPYFYAINDRREPGQYAVYVMSAQALDGLISECRYQYLPWATLYAKALRGSYMEAITGEVKWDEAVFRVERKKGSVWDVKNLLVAISLMDYSVR